MPHEIGDHSYFAYLAVDALHAELIGKGAIILRGPKKQPWGRWEMAVGTPGHRMMFAQSS